MPKFKDSRGLPTVYALRCGYVAEFDHNGIRTMLWHEGGPLYHVRQHNHNTGKRIFWESFERAADAKQHFLRTRRTATSQV